MEQEDNASQDSLSSETQQASTENVKQRSNRRALLAILLGLVVIILLALLAWIYTESQTTTVTPPAQKTKLTSSLTPNEVIDKIKTDLDDKYELLNLDKDNSPEDGQASIRVEKRGPAYKTTGYKYYTDTSEASSIDIMLGSAQGDLPTPEDIQARKDVATIYKEFGMQKTDTRGEVSNGNGSDVYTGKGLVCTVESPESASSPSAAACGTLTSYKAVAKKYQPFANALPSLSDETVLTNLEITTSKVPGYQTASLGQGEINSGGGSVALFYKTPDEKWHYFMNTQQGIPCVEYNTVDLRNAYKGQQCFDDKNENAKVE